MSKIVRVADGDYKIVTQPNGIITLDTGNQIGQVIITGDLVVQGNTTTVDSETLTIKDNIIYLNVGEAGTGVTLGSAGLTIERGLATDVSMLYDESSDTFRFIDGLGTLVPLQSNYIKTGGNDLRLIGTGTNVVTVTGTANYENFVTDDDDLPNRKWVTDYVLASGGVAIVDRFYAYASGYLNTGGRAYDTGAGDPYSKITFEVDGTVVAEIEQTGVSIVGSATIDQVQISDNYITTINSNSNLELRANGAGVVLVDDTLGLNFQGSAPSSSSGMTKVYSQSTPGTGGTGIRFLNSTVNGELISSKKALLYSLLF